MRRATATGQIWSVSPATRPTGAWLAARLQTRVYRYVLVRAGSQLNRGAELGPEQIEMVYWFAAFPGQPERLPYNRTQHAADGRYLASLIADLFQADDDDFPLTDDATRCRFCPYRSLCGRGVEAGDLHVDDADAGASEAAATDWATSFDFEQVGEIAF